MSHKYYRQLQAAPSGLTLFGFSDTQKRITTTPSRIAQKALVLARWVGLFALATSCQLASASIGKDVKVSTNQNKASSTVTTPAFSTSASNELLLAFVASDSAGSTNVSVKGVTGGGLTWVLVKRTNTQAGTAEIWRAFAPAILKNVTVSATLTQSVASLITVSSYSGVAVSGTNGSGAVGATGSGNASSGAPTASLVTTQNNSLVVGVGNDFDSAIARTPTKGQSLLHQDLSSTGDTYWVQSFDNPTKVAGTQVTVSDASPTSDRYNLSICEIVAAADSLGVSASSLAFGTVMDGSSSTLNLTLSATGTSAVTVNSVSISGTGFTDGSVSWPQTLAAGQSLSLPVKFAPVAAGAVSGTLTINSTTASGASSSTVALTGTGEAPNVPVLGASAGSLAFGSVTDGSTKSLSLTLSSTGTAPVVINAASISGTGFTLGVSAWPQTLSPGQTLAIPVQFAPTKAGAVTGSLTISSNSSSGGTASIALSGTGTAASNPVLSVSASTLAFGSITDGTSKALNLTLSSTGTSAVTINSAAISGTGFTLAAGSWPQTLSAGQSLTLQVSFAPTTAGAITGNLTIGSNSTSGSSTSISLTGTGVAATNPILSLNTTSLAFGTVSVGSSSSLSVTLTSTGTSAVTISSAAISGTGFSIASGSFPVTLNANQSTTISVDFVPTAIAAESGTLTIKSNSTSGGTATVALSGTGSGVAHSVDLNWNAASNTPDPVAGYHIYRSTGTTFTLLNAALDTQTSYLDSTVVGGTTYSYEIKSVDYAGVESLASNLITVTIPAP